MKANLKGGNVVVRFLLAHGEKIGMAGIVVCVGMLVWSAIGRERLDEDQQPEDLKELITRTESHIKGFRWEDADEDSKIVATPVSSEGMTEIPRTGFPPFAGTYERHALDPVGLRNDPILLAAEELEVNGDSGLWVTANPETIKKKRSEARMKEDREANEQKSRETNASPRAGARGAPGAGLFGNQLQSKNRTAKRSKSGTIVLSSFSGVKLEGYEDVKADSWVTVLARIPVKQQSQKYDEVLQSASGFNSTTDVPDYFAYLVQRAEITGTGQGKWKTIAQIKDKTITERLKTYPVQMDDVIDPRYYHPLLTHPLPPLILREWDQRASHSSMPLDSAVKKARPVEGVVEEKNEDGEFFSDQPSPTRSNPRGDTPRRGPSRSERDASFPRGERGPRSANASLVVQNASHKLFRYFDNTVKPGHRYRYRVKLVLRDVNHLSSEQYLDKSVIERRSKTKKELRPFRLTEWSEPSPIVSVPLPARIYLASAKPAKETNVNAEPEAQLLIKALNSQYKAEIALAKYFPRGSVINVHEKADVVWSNDYTSEQNSEFDFNTGITLLDFSGGEKLSRRNKDLTSPTRAVLMDASGRLFLQSELDDLRPVAAFQRVISGERPSDSGRGKRGNRRE